MQGRGQSMAKINFDSVDEYIAARPETSRKTLNEVRRAIRRAIPGGEETISYNIPAYKAGGAAVIYFAGWKHHYSLYPVNASVLAQCSHETGSYKVEKSTIRFPLDEPVPARLIACIVEARAEGIASRPRKERTGR